MPEPVSPPPGWLRAVQAFEMLFFLAAAVLVVTGLAPGLGAGVAVGTLLVAVTTQVLVVRRSGQDR